MTAAFTPDKDKVQVGDTIYLVSEFPSTLTPIGSQAPVDYTNAATIGSAITIVEYLPNKERKWYVYDFDFIAMKGEAFNSTNIPVPEAAEGVRYVETNGKYEMKIAIVPKKKGNYAFLLSNAYSDSRAIKGKDRCDRATFSISLQNDHQASVALMEKWSDGPVGEQGNVYAFTVN
ncbi:hypothetical protein [Adhaeribacter pallidiroseus]|uniref:hypothetical protein n=1 Tax=Adhaeribacter pallidiroseus TaxID=2072847 RepID=UPI0011C073F1|nr:hypothetical protein [Adhaeribacter pallidiroseus]